MWNNKNINIRGEGFLGLFIGITLCVFFVACGGGGGGDGTGTPGTSPTDTRPSFDSDIGPKNYVQNEAITPFTLPVATGGNGDLTYNFIPVTKLPAGLSFDSETREFSGTPTAAGSTDVLYTATDEDGDEAWLLFSIEVIRDLQPIFTEFVPSLEFVPGESITPVILPEVRGGDGDLTYTLAPGTMLPDGLMFNSETRELSGMPTTPGRTTVTFMATDADGDETSLMFSIEVTRDLQPIFTDLVQYRRYTQGTAITPLTLPEASGGDGDLIYSLTPNSPATMLPAGLEFDSSTRVLSGTPTALGSTTVTYTATDEDGDVDMFTFRIEIGANDKPRFTGHRRLGITALQYIKDSEITPNPLRLPLALGQTPMTYNLTVNSPATMLPDGLRYVNLTRLTGTPRVTGTTSVTYTVTDRDGDEISFTFDIVVRPPVSTGICDRTQQVQDAILEQIGGTTTCSVVTPEHLASITRLDLHEKGITSLQPNDFYGLTGLVSLNLRGNMIATLPEDIFYGLLSLSYLYMSSNALTTLPEGVFDGLISLVSLSLGNNALTTLPEGVFDGPKSSALLDLSLSSNALTTLPEGVFDGLALRSLFLSGNDLTTLPSDVFDGLTTNTPVLGPISLQELGLSNNRLTTLPEDLFDGLSHLTSLGLSGNSLTDLPSDVFDGLSSLTSLRLSGNSLTTLPSDVFDGLSSLTSLGLSGNSLETLPSGVFDGLSSLERLNLIGSSLETLSSGVFNGLSSLERLDLSENSLTTLPENLFDGTSITTLRLQENSLTTLPSGVFNGLSSLSELHLHKNDLTDLHEDLFDGLSSLERLWLQENSLTTLPSGAFNGLSSLRTLRLQENSLTTLPSGAFNGLSSLGWLYLQTNSLTTLPSGVFNELSSLEWLDLSSNSLMTLPSDVFNGLSSLRIDLRQNTLDSTPTSCDQPTVVCFIR